MSSEKHTPPAGQKAELAKEARLQSRWLTQAEMDELRRLAKETSAYGRKVFAKYRPKPTPADDGQE